MVGGRPQGLVVAGMVLLLAGMLSGCASAPSGPATANDPGLPAGTIDWPDLPCERDTGAGLSRSLEVVSFEPFAGDPMVREEMDSVARDGRTWLAIARPGTGGVDLLDVTDPRRPDLVSTWDPEEGYADDIKFVPDGSAIVIVGSDRMRLVDYSDLREPRLETEHELEASGAHMVATWAMDGQAYASLSKAEGGDVSIFRLEGPAGSRSFTRLSHLAATPLGEPATGRPDLVRSHDTWFEVDPPTGRPLLWVANVWWGVVAYDVSDPALPVVAAMLPNPPPFPGYMHNVQVAHIEGRRLVVGVQEYGTGVLKVWDATDLEAPRHVASFAPGLLTTAFHNLQVVGQYVFAGHFDEGLYVLDLADVPDGPVAQEMTQFAHAPAAGVREDRVPVGLVQGNFGTQDVEVRDGVVWTSEAGLGLQALAFGCLRFGEPWHSSTG